MRRLRTEERGFTLMEMLVAMVVGMIVCLAVFSLVEVVMRRSGDISDRVDTTQRARTAMDQITRQLRSQVCTQKNVTGQAARTIDSATSNSIAVFTDFNNDTVSGDAAVPPDLRKLTFDPVSRVLTENVITGTRAGTNSNAINYTGTGKTRRVLANVAAMDYRGDVPVFFRYWGYTPGTKELKRELIPSASGLTSDELDDVARIDLHYRVYARNNTRIKSSTVLKNSVFLRTSTPNAEEAKTACTAY